MVTRAIGIGNEDLPAVLGKRAPPGNGDRNAQPVRRRDIFTSRRVNNERHVTPLSANKPRGMLSSNFHSSVASRSGGRASSPAQIFRRGGGRRCIPGRSTN